VGSPCRRGYCTVGNKDGGGTFFNCVTGEYLCSYIASTASLASRWIAKPIVSGFRSVRTRGGCGLGFHVYFMRLVGGTKHAVSRRLVDVRCLLRISTRLIVRKEIAFVRFPSTDFVFAVSNAANVITSSRKLMYAYFTPTKHRMYWRVRRAINRTINVYWVR